MKLRLASDIHTEFFSEDEIRSASKFILPELVDDKDTVLVLAGDIGSMQRTECLHSFVHEVAPRFSRILYIPGNHEYYGGDLETTPDFIEGMFEDIENLTFSKNGSAFIDGKTFFLQTMWTDFDGANPDSMLEARLRMNDYRLIRNGDRAAIPEDMLIMHRMHLSFLLHYLREGDIVITHHLPSFKSVPAAYQGERVNGAYATNLEKLILEKKPALWCHGHTHDAFDYKIGETRILCNPRGYGNQYKNNGYNSTLVVNI